MKTKFCKVGKLTKNIEKIFLNVVFVSLAKMLLQLT